MCAFASVAPWYFAGLLTQCVFIRVMSQQSCPPPDLPAEGRYIPQQKRYLPGDRVAYACKDGFTLLGKQIRTCKSNGAWSDRMPFCDRPAKMKNPRVTNSFSSAVSRVADGNSNTCFHWQKSTGHSMLLYMEDQVVVHALRIFLGNGSTKIQILTGVDNNFKVCADYDRIIERSQWVFIWCKGADILADSIKILSTADRVSNTTICEIQVFVKDEYGCENPPEIRIFNGYFEVSRNKATLLCEEGYKGENTRLVCESNSWKGLGPRCEELLCDPVVTNTTNSQGSEWVFLDSVRKLSAGTRRRLECGSGYRKVGSPDTTTCQKDGTWSKTNATCIEEKAEASTKVIIIATVSAVVAVIILILLTATIILIKKQKNREVVVVFKPTGEGSTSTEAEYSMVPYYETVIPGTGAPLPPNSPRPAGLPSVLNERYLISDDAKGSLRRQAPTPADIAFGTLKQSTLYGS